MSKIVPFDLALATDSPNRVCFHTNLVHTVVYFNYLKKADDSCCIISIDNHGKTRIHSKFGVCNSDPTFNLYLKQLIKTYKFWLIESASGEKGTTLPIVVVDENKDYSPSLNPGDQILEEYIYEEEIS